MHMYVLNVFMPMKVHIEVISWRILNVLVLVCLYVLLYKACTSTPRISFVSFHTACKKVCRVAIDIPVCGTNGITYPNSCEMNKAAGCLDQDIRRAYRAECEEQPQKGMLGATSN